MNEYLVIKEVGNGYFCGCCRRTSTETDIMSFKNDQEAVEYAKRINDKSRENDVEITNIYALRMKTVEEFGETWTEGDYEVFSS